MENILVHTIFILIIALFVSAVVRTYMCKLNMMKNAKLDHRPAGATLCEGMVLNTEKRGLIRDSQPSLSWYVRLFNSSN